MKWEYFQRDCFSLAWPIVHCVSMNHVVTMQYSGGHLQYPLCHHDPSCDCNYVGSHNPNGTYFVASMILSHNDPSLYYAILWCPSPPSIHCHHDPSSDYAILWCPSPTILTVSAWPQWWLCNTMVSFTYNTHCVSMTPVVTMQYCGVQHLQYPLS